jgi:hypothetical protein
VQVTVKENASRLVMPFQRARDDVWKTAELFCGVACGLLGPLPLFLRHGAYAFELMRFSLGNLLDAVLLFFLPGLLVAIGSYLHSVRRRTTGLILLLIGGIFLTLMVLGLFFSGAVFYLYGIPGGVVILLQGVLALITMISVIVGSVPATQQS